MLCRSWRLRGESLSCYLENCLNQPESPQKMISEGSFFAPTPFLSLVSAVRNQQVAADTFPWRIARSPGLSGDQIVFSGLIRIIDTTGILIKSVKTLVKQSEQNRNLPGTIVCSDRKRWGCADFISRSG